MKRLELAGRPCGDTAVGHPLGTSGRISFHERGDDGTAIVTSAINRSLLAGAGAGAARAPPLAGILVTEGSRGRRRALALVFRDQPDVIGCDGGPGSDDDDDDAAGGDDDELAEPSAVLTAEERAFLNLTKRNTDFNSINSNLTGASRTLVDWVDENDRTTERSALTGRHKKFTPLVSVAPFSTGRGPGPLKVNPVAPMQNGQVVTTERRQEMVERKFVAERVTRREERVTRLDDPVTRLDDPVTRLDSKVTKLDDKVTKLDDKVTKLDDKVTKLDSKVTKLDGNVPKLDGNVPKLDEKVTRLDDSPKSSGDEASSEAPSSEGCGPAATSEVKPASVRSAPPASGTAGDGSRPAAQGTSQSSAGGGGSRGPVTGPVEPEKRTPSRPAAADRNDAATASGDDATGRESTAAAAPPMTNIELIKSRLAEKAAQNGVASWRSPGNHPERNRERLNSLDGVPKSPKLKAPTAPVTDGTERAERVAAGGRAQSPPRDVCSSAAAESRKPAVCDRVTESRQSAAGPDKNSAAAPHRPADTHRSESATKSAPAPDAEPGNNAATAGARPAAAAATAARKSPIVNDKPKLTAKPGKVRPLDRRLSSDGDGRRLSQEKCAAPQTSAAAEEVAEGRGKPELARGPSSAAEPDVEDKPIAERSVRPMEPDKALTRLMTSNDDEITAYDMPAEESNKKFSSYSPKSSIHLGFETKPSLVETKTQRAMKREKELERQREELEKKNREAKKNLAQSEPAKPDRRPSVTPQETEPVPTGALRDVDPAPPVQSGNIRGSGLYSQISRANQRRASQDTVAAPQPPAPAASAAPADPAAPADQRASTSTDDDDEEDVEPPPPPKRALSVSPPSRKRGGVSFAPGTEDPRASGVKLRSQSMPRQGALDLRHMRDEEAHARPSGEERRSRRDEPRSRARFFLKKFLKFGRDEKCRERDQVYGEFRHKPEIIHPIDRAGVGCVQVIGRPSERRDRDGVEPRRRRDRTGQDGTAGTQDTAPAAQASPSAPPRLPQRQNPPAAHPSHPSQRVTSGLTPEGRPKPPPPPPPSSCRQAADSAGPRPLMTPPSRPPPPNPHLLSRSRDAGARPPDTDYANLGVSRAGLTPKKPGRGVRGREGGERSEQRPPPSQPAGAESESESESTGLRRLHPSRVSLRDSPVCAPPASLEDSYDAVTSANREALRQLWDQMTRFGPVREALRSLQAAPRALRDFQVSPQSRQVVGSLVFVEALYETEPVVLCLTDGPMAAEPLSVSAVIDFTDSVPSQLLAGPEPGSHGAEAIGTVHVIPAVRVQPLTAALAAAPPLTSDVTSQRPAQLLLLQTVQQLQRLQEDGRETVDNCLSQLVALTAEDGAAPRVAAVLSCPADPPAEGRLSACLAALSALLRLLAVPAAAERARDGRGVSSVPDGPAVTQCELLASLLQRDDAASLRRAAAVLACWLWAPAGLAPTDAARWLHRERAALLGSAVRAHTLDLEQTLRLGFLAETEPETVGDALELMNI